MIISLSGKRPLRLSILLLLLAFGTYSKAQDSRPPFWNDIQAFRASDSVSPPPQHAILFVGSSSFTKWTDVASYFPGYVVINRGFGGSSLPDVIRYADDIIFPYHPKQIVIYCGENDLAGDTTITADTVVVRFKHLFSMIRSHLGAVPVVFVSLKPSPSRWALRNKMQQANAQIKKYLATQKNTAFVDVYHAMLNAKGLPRPEIFIEDKLHMNAKGYAIWQKLLKPHLLK